MKRKVLIFLIILFIVSFSLRFSLSELSPVKYWDETIYSNLGRNLLIYHEYSFLHGFADFSPDWPLAGFRPPLLPFLISIISMFSFDGFYLNLLIPLVSSLGVIGVFLLSKEIFNGRVAIFSSIIFLLIPQNLFWGSKILSDTLFVTLMVFSCYLFWLAFESRKGRWYPILFGGFLGLAFLSRYSLIWFFPIFFVYLLIRNKNVNFLAGKYFWMSCVSFSIIVLPWFIYNYFQYGSFLGFLSQANEATLRWGVQSFSFYISYFINNFFVFIPLLIIGLWGLFNREYKKPIIFMLLWFFIIFLSLSIMGHKEERYFLPVIPALCILSGLGIYNFKRYWSVAMVVVLVILLYLNLFIFLNAYSAYNSLENKCFFSAMDFLKNSDASSIVTEHFSPVYFYTLKNNIRVDNYTRIESIILTSYKNENVYYYYVDGDWFNLVSENPKLAEKKLYECGDFKVFNISF
jgi:4-amino-4-deoxy-L-arabinose transferase-like glycosyltransferase